MSDEIKTIKLSEIEEDPVNANAHTERGQWMLGKSMQEFGFAEAGTLDKNNRIIGGHLRTEVAADVLNAEEAIVIDVDGTKPVFIRRIDLDSDDPKTKELGIALNRTAQVSIEFDPEALAELHEMEVDIGNWFSDAELNEIFENAEGDFEGLDSTNKDDDSGAMVEINVRAPAAVAQEIMNFLDGLSRRGVKWSRGE